MTKHPTSELVKKQQQTVIVIYDAYITQFNQKVTVCSDIYYWNRTCSAMTDTSTSPWSPAPHEPQLEEANGQHRHNLSGRQRVVEYIHSVIKTETS